MQYLNSTNLDSPEARNEQRLKAIPMLLALELAEHYQYLQDEELIAHEDLETAIYEKLGLESSDGHNYGLYTAINDQMVAWNWQWLTFDCGFQDFYAKPQNQTANLISLWGGKRMLQAGQYFPEYFECIADELWESDFAAPFVEAHSSGLWTPQEELRTQKEILEAFFKAHLIPINPTSL